MAIPERSSERIINGQEKFLGAFMKMLDEKPYEKITVSDLCRKAGVSRNTFYRNFSDKEDLLYFLVDTVFASYLSDKEGQHKSKNILMHFLQFYRDNHEMMELLSQSRLTALFVRYYMVYSYRDADSYEVSDESYRWAVSFLVAGMFSVYEIWREENFKTPLEEIIEELNRAMPGLNVLDETFYQFAHPDAKNK